MQEEFTVSITGDSIINRRISVVNDDRFLALIKIIRDADVGFTHLETLIHDYVGPEIYPAAEAGWTWMRSPRFVAEELKWAGFDILSHAGNHAMDYCFGGLYSTWRALDEAGLAHAGTGRNLGDARAPAYLEMPKGRVALISMCSSFAGGARAGDTRTDSNGRPGINPLRFYYVVDANTMKQVEDLAKKLGLKTRWQDKMFLTNPPGLNLSVTRYEQSDVSGVTTVVDEDDAEGNLRAIKDARRQADWVIVHLHSHWSHSDKQTGYSTEAKFVAPFARACIDAGADIFTENGRSVVPGGVEIYKNKPIIYNPGVFLHMSPTVTRLPADFYLRPGYPEEVRSPKATPADGFDARITLRKRDKPSAAGIEKVGSVVAVCSFGERKALKEIRLYPFSDIEKRRNLRNGIPWLDDVQKGKLTIEHVAKVSSRFGTKVEFKDGIGLIRL